MPTPTYFFTGYLTDIGVHVLNPDYVAKLTVRPEEEALGPDGLVSDQPVPVAVNASTGAFSMELIPSNKLTGRSGQVGVKYVLELAWFKNAIDGTFPAWNGWRFTAVAPGGPIADMGDVPPFAIYIGPPWPTRKAPGAYFSPKSGWLGMHRIGA